MQCNCAEHGMFYNCILFGLRARNEHRSREVSHITVRSDVDFIGEKTHKKL